MIELLQILSIFIHLQVSSPCTYDKDGSLNERCMLEELSSKKYFGRGYVNNGRNKAALLIKSEFKTAGLKPFFEDGFFQEFPQTVNVFEKAPELVCDGKVLELGVDFIVHPASGSGVFENEKIIFLDKDKRTELSKDKKLNAFLFQTSNQGNAIILEQEKLTWSVSDFAFPNPIIETTKKCSEWKLEVSNELKETSSKNVVGYVPAQIKTDSCLFITAHYDHLGGMGKDVFIPGANDNAAGTVMLMDLARYYAKNPHHKYNVVFVAFAGEEAGLLGSKYFSEQYESLNKIKFLFNLDLVGTGEKGATVVNATEYPEQFKILTGINNTKNYLPKIKARGSAANSDHFWFHQKGVPSFFLYTMGGPSAYHDVNDKAETLPLSHYQEVMNLVINFYQSL